MSPGFVLVYFNYLLSVLMAQLIHVTVSPFFDHFLLCSRSDHVFNHITYVNAFFALSETHDGF